MKKFKKYIQAAISVVLLAVLIHWINLEQFFSLIENANYLCIVFALILIPVDRLIMTYKWNLLLKEKNIQISLFEAFKIYYISNFVGLFLPPTIGGDIFRVTYVIKQKYSTPDVIASILVERLLGFLALFTFGFYGIIILITTIDNLYLSSVNIIIIALTIIILASFIFIFSFNSKVSYIVNKIFSILKNWKHIPKFLEKVEKLIASYQSYKARKITLLYFFLLTLLEIFLASFVNFLIAVGLHADVSLVYFSAFIPIMMIITRMPISLDGFGIKEGGTLYFLSLVGISNALGFSIGLLSHVLTLISISPGGVFYFLDQTKKEVKKVLVKQVVENESG